MKSLESILNRLGILMMNQRWAESILNRLGIRMVNQRATESILQSINKSAKQGGNREQPNRFFNRSTNQLSKGETESNRIDSQSISKSAKQGESREQMNRFSIDQEIGPDTRTAVNRFSIDWKTESILNRLDEQI